MKKLLLFSLFFFSLSLYSDENKKSKLSKICENVSFDLGGGAGYRQDWLGLTIDRRVAYSGTFFKQDFDNLHIAITEAWGKLVIYNVQLFIQADYGWAQSNHLDTTINFFDMPNGPFAKYNSSVHGDVFDTRGSLAYQLNLWKKDCNRFAIVPQSGFSLHHQSLHQSDTSPRPFTTTVSPFPLVSQTDVTLDLSIKRLKRTWWGPFLGGSLLGEYKWFEGEIGYLYHWLKLSECGGFRLIDDVFAGNLLAQTVTLKAQADETFDGKYSHEFFGSLIFQVVKHFKIALRGNYMVAKHKRENTSFDAIFKQEAFLPPPGSTTIETTPIPTKTSGDWHTFSILLDLILAF